LVNLSFYGFDGFFSFFLSASTVSFVTYPFSGKLFCVGNDLENSPSAFCPVYTLGFQVYLYIGITLSDYNLAQPFENFNMGNCTNSQFFSGTKRRMKQNSQNAP